MHQYYMLMVLMQACTASLELAEWTSRKSTVTRVIIRQTLVVTSTGRRDLPLVTVLTLPLVSLAFDMVSTAVCSFLLWCLYCVMISATSVLLAENVFCTHSYSHILAILTATLLTFQQLRKNADRMQPYLKRFSIVIIISTICCHQLRASYAAKAWSS